MSKSLDTSAPLVDRTVAQVIDTIAETTPEVRTALVEHRGYAGEENPSGDKQLAADVRADKLFEERLLDIDAVGSYASEERASLATDEGRLHVTMDPLDGSSNLDPNSGMGSIFGVYTDQPPTSGRNLVAAGFVIYGPVTSMTVARDGRVTEAVVEDGQRRIVDEDVTVPSDPTVYGFGGGDDSWTADFQAFADELREALKLRYGGAMIADINQVLSYGGLFSYPGLQERPEGKLRAQFEGQPMAYVVETAGGRSSDGERSLLDTDPDDLHERTPLFLGNAGLVDRAEQALD